jgi:ribose 5-phosphate isomerase A
VAHEAAKQIAARTACSWITDGMTVGLGTGSTAVFALDRIAELMASGYQLAGVATSSATEEQARTRGLQLLDLNEVEKLDLAIDGADEVDPAGNLIKGGGGALTREKLVALAADELVIVVDESKLVERLGAAFRLPVAILPFGWRHTLRRLSRFGEGELRTRDGLPYATDNGNHIVDLQLPGGVAPEQVMQLDHDLSVIPGVVEHGLFVGLTTRVVVGSDDRQTRIIEIPRV